MIELYLLSIMLIILLIVLNSSQRIKKKKSKTIHLARIVHSLRLLLEYLAKHRGMTNAYLKGDHSFKQAINNLQLDIDKVFEQLTKIETNADALNNTPAYQKMRNHWMDLKAKAYERNPAENFKLHITLIEDVIENIAAEGLYIETALNEIPNAKIIANALVTEIPHFVEILGQARGIGTGAIAQGGCTVDIRMNLKYLYDELQSMIHSLEKLKLVNTNRLSDQLDMSTLVSNSIAEVQKFSSLLKTNLLDAKTPDVTTENLYKHGTEAITKSLRLFDTLYPLCLARIDIRI